MRICPNLLLQLETKEKQDLGDPSGSLWFPLMNDRKETLAEHIRFTPTSVQPRDQKLWEERSWGEVPSPLPAAPHPPILDSGGREQYLFAAAGSTGPGDPP